MNLTFFTGILVGCAATVSLNVGKGVQKMKVHVLTKRWAMFSPEHRRDLFIWLLGLSMTAGASPLYSVALKMTDKPSIVSSLGGVGLVALAVFSYFVLRERIGLIECMGVLFIIAGTVLMGLFDVKVPTGQVYSPSGLSFSLMFLVVVFAAAVPYSLRTKKYHGIVFGALAGVLIGVSIILADIALVKADNDLIGQLSTPHIYLAIVISAFALAVTQFAFFRGRAIEVVPCINSFLILTPVFMERFTFDISLLPIQYMSLLIIVVGVVILSSTTPSLKTSGPI